MMRFQPDIQNQTVDLDPFGSANFYYDKFGVDEEGYILKDQENNRYEGCCVEFLGTRRGDIRHIKVHRDGNKIRYDAKLPNEEKEESDLDAIAKALT